MGMQTVLVLAMVALMAALTPYADRVAPSQVKDWEGYDRDSGIIVFMKIAAAFALGGVALHAGWYAFVSKEIRSCNNFVQLCLSLFFTYNWLYIIFVGTPTPLSIGAQSGACAGYEIYGLLTELVELVVLGIWRPAMLLHHTLCAVFTAVTLAVYVHVPVHDLFYWHLVWDSISRCLVSNVALNLKFFFPKSAAARMFFFVLFLWVRAAEQVPFLRQLYRSPRDWQETSTGVVVAGWIVLCALNFYWSALVFKIALFADSKRSKKQAVE
ncbi:hypothetical protein DIPPA_24770 [Diplonema papillatum]|nr:hypothetical protein DIPPA_24770 [Diplonema papillatum]|eukprot:gene22118-33931_t